MFHAEPVIRGRNGIERRFVCVEGVSVTPISDCVRRNLEPVP